MQINHIKLSGKAREMMTKRLSVDKLKKTKTEVDLKIKEKSDLTKSIEIFKPEEKRVLID